MMNKIYTYWFTFLMILLVFTPFAVDRDLINGVNKAKDFWFYGVCILLIVSASFYQVFKYKASIKLHWPDLLIVAYYLFIVGRIFFDNPILFHLEKFTVQTLMVILYFSIKSFWSGVDSKSRTELFHLFSVGLMFAASGQAVLGLAQLYGFSSSYNALFQITGTFVNPAPFSFFLGAVFPVALYLYLHQKQTIQTVKPGPGISLLDKLKCQLTLNHLVYYTSIVTLIMILLVLPVTLIRTGWVMAISGSAVVLYFHYKKDINLFFTRRSYRYAAVFIFAVLLLTASFGAYQLKKDSADGRFLIWEITLDKIKETPLLGQGYGSFYSQYNNWQADWFADQPDEKDGPKAMLAGNVKFAYNEYLEIFTEVGLIGLVLFVIFIGLIIYYLLNRSSELNHNGIVLLSSLLAILAGSFLSYPLFSLSTYILLILWLALAAGQHPAIEVFKIPKISSLTMLVLISILTVFFIKREYSKYLAYQDLKFATYFMETQSYEVAIREFEKLYPVLHHDGSYLQHYGKALSLGNQPTASNEMLHQAMVFNSDIFLYTTMGDNYKALNEHDKAENAYQQAIDMVPHKFFAPYLLAKLYHENGNAEKAEKMANELLIKEIKIPSTAIEEIKQEMKNILTARYPEQKAPEREKSDAQRKGTGSKEDV
ncbi:MAG: O-antigen ligase family protein [Cyclobacteriaceae bacterium]